LQRAFGTAQAFFTVPHEIWSGWSPYGTGFYNELVIVDLIAELERAGLKDEAATLRGFWEHKVKNFVNRDQDLFRSEYAFDSTGFESTHALAKYAMQHADQSGETRSSIPLANAKTFLEKQMAGNLFCRGWLEPAYYYLGSDYRGGGGNAYVLTYMSQMGGWSVLDYGLNFATNRAPYLRLGFASYLSAWALMNSHNVNDLMIWATLMIQLLHASTSDSPTPGTPRTATAAGISSSPAASAGHSDSAAPSPSPSPS
jgi:hypothetical protein